MLSTLESRKEDKCRHTVARGELALYIRVDYRLPLYVLFLFAASLFLFPKTRKLMRARETIAEKRITKHFQYNERKKILWMFVNGTWNEHLRKDLLIVTLVR